VAFRESKVTMKKPSSKEEGFLKKWNIYLERLAFFYDFSIYNMIARNYS
jgi:hypothetical protein